MSLQSWGMYPKVKNTTFKFNDRESIKTILSSHHDLIPHGNGRSYGDSALSSNIVHVRPQDYFIEFNQGRGLLHVQSGVLLSEILESFVPRGWFLKITPGTKLITVGGAIASDVHGKNHHIEGCISECVEAFNIMLPKGEIVTCSKETTPELWKATCGGQGLTGIILDAKIQLKRIDSQYLDQITIKTKNLKETFEAFETCNHMPYSVAWIDCLSKGESMGRSLLMVGEFRNDGELDYHPKTQKKHSI